jgi:hypothetical protein
MQHEACLLFYTISLLVKFSTGEALNKEIQDKDRYFTKKRDSVNI